MGARTWRPWSSAWLDAAYGPAGFWTREQPGDHFATGVGVGSLVSRAVAARLPPDSTVVVDVGAGDGRLLAALGAVLPGVALVGVDRRPRPPGLGPVVGWVQDHWDVERERWSRGGPEAWLASSDVPLLVAHEWLDDLPAVVAARGSDGWREVEVDDRGAERVGHPLAPVDAAWLDRWWPTGDRAEVGRSREVAWAGLVRSAVARGGRALAVDYGHLRGSRPHDGSLVAYGRGRQREPVPDGSVNLTAAVAVDALAAAGEAAGGTTLALARQADVLGAVPDAPAADPLAGLVGRSERAALVDPGRWGGLWWLLQG